MPDIREVLNALEEKDRVLYSYLRTEMVSVYLKSIHETLGVTNFNQEDHAFMDLIDIKLAILFDRAGKFNMAKGSIDEEAANAIEQQIVEAASGLKLKSSTQSQRVLDSYAPKTNINGQALPQAAGWKN